MEDPERVAVVCVTGSSPGAVTAAGCETSRSVGGCRVEALLAEVDPLHLPIRAWLVSTHPVLGIYAEAFAEYGYEDTGFLRGAREEDLTEAMAELKVKKPHRRTILIEFRRLLDDR